MTGALHTGKRLVLENETGEFEHFKLLRQLGEKRETRFLAGVQWEAVNVKQRWFDSICFARMPRNDHVPDELSMVENDVPRVVTRVDLNIHLGLRGIDNLIRSDIGIHLVVTPPSKKG